jgi:hypothetical protein
MNQPELCDNNNFLAAENKTYGWLMKRLDVFFSEALCPYFQALFRTVGAQHFLTYSFALLGVPGYTVNQGSHNLQYEYVHDVLTNTDKLLLLLEKQPYTTLLRPPSPYECHYDPHRHFDSFERNSTYSPTAECQAAASVKLFVRQVIMVQLIKALDSNLFRIGGSSPLISVPVVQQPTFLAACFADQFEPMNALLAKLQGLHNAWMSCKRDGLTVELGAEFKNHVLMLNLSKFPPSGYCPLGIDIQKVLISC